MWWYIGFALGITVWAIYAVDKLVTEYNEKMVGMTVVVMVLMSIFIILWGVP